MNLPNRLSIARIILAPVCMVLIIYPVFGDIVTPITALLLFTAASLTDMFDGKIARKRGLVTDFGKFIDPVADKMLVLGTMFSLVLARRTEPVASSVIFWCAFLIFVREIGITSIRAVIMGKVDVAANKWGKAKTTMQMIALHVAIVEPLFIKITNINTMYIPTMALLAVSAVLAVISGIIYMRAYLPYLDTGK
ncbi:MAG: CDP-diacylglycerol--glycerol-3-phosphate 3-phosphatidyltransferase [Clostridia bacterium]|nr:CDP-diacylglycerol--glycerol-3-phosphate 3-phosphatidyltransferase [Clostridia bacterium]